MNTIKCFDVVKPLIDETTARLGPLWGISIFKLSVLEDYCRVIDSIFNEFDGTCYSVETDEIHLTIRITVTLADLTIEKKTHDFYRLAERSQNVGFSVSEDGNLNVSFVFPSVWEKL